MGSQAAEALASRLLAEANVSTGSWAGCGYRAQCRATRWQLRPSVRHLMHATEHGVPPPPADIHEHTDPSAATITGPMINMHLASAVRPSPAFHRRTAAGKKEREPQTLACLVGFPTFGGCVPWNHFGKQTFARPPAAGASPTCATPTPTTPRTCTAADRRQEGHVCRACRTDHDRTAALCPAGLPARASSSLSHGGAAGGRCRRSTAASTSSIPSWR